MKEKTSISQKLQKFGSVLAGMVIPNIGAFIGFGLITAFFLETGWTPNAKLAKLNIFPPHITGWESMEKWSKNVFSHTKGPRGFSAFATLRCCS